MKYKVLYGDLAGTKKLYAVVAMTSPRKVVFSSDSKSECIAKSQELNGWTIDGDEGTYGKQIEEQP